MLLLELFSPINPPIITERNSKIYFDLSDSSLSFVDGGVSYSAFELNLYSDPELNNLFVTSGKTDDFNVARSGRVGVDAKCKSYY